MCLRTVRWATAVALWPIADGERAWKRCSNTARALNLGLSVEANGECTLSGGRQSKKNTVRATPAPVESAPGDGYL
jgi:hypothetical protein